MKPGRPAAVTMPTIGSMPPRSFATPCNNTSNPRVTRRTSLPISAWLFIALPPPVATPAWRRAPSIVGRGAACIDRLSAAGHVLGLAGGQHLQVFQALGPHQQRV